MMALRARYGLRSEPPARFSKRSPGPSPTTRSEQVRLSGAQATAVGANDASAKRLYELMLGASISVSSRRQVSCPARKDAKTDRSRANNGPSSSFSEK